MRELEEKKEILLAIRNAIANINLEEEFNIEIDNNDLNELEEKVLIEAKEKEVNENNLFEVAKFLGDFYYNLIYIHPFREGNGRSIREYLREFVEYKFPDLSINYDKVDKRNFLLGITERDTYPLLIAYEFYNSLKRKDKILKK